MLKCPTSLWSADLGNLAAEMKRIEPFSERWHLDVADGHYVKNLLFFPDSWRSFGHIPQSRLKFISWLPIRWAGLIPSSRRARTFSSSVSTRRKAQVRC